MEIKGLLGQDMVLKGPWGQVMGVLLTSRIKKILVLFRELLIQ